MDTFELLGQLRQLEVRLWADGGRLRFSAPQGALTEELRSQLARRKGEILSLLREADDAGFASIEPIPRDQDLPLSFSQLRVWFLEQFEPGTVAFHMPEAVRLRGGLDVAALHRSLYEIVRRHESLRTTFVAVGGQPVQVIAPAPRIELPVVDLGRLEAEGRECTTARLAEMAAKRPFSIERGPLIRTILLRLGEREHIFLLNLHHIVFDRWSMGVFLDEMAALYRAFLAGPEARSPLPEPKIQYVDFAAWQRRWLQGEVLESLLSYWRQQLAGASGVLRLPTDRPRPLVRTEQGGRFPVALPAPLTAALKKRCSEHGTTLFMVLLAALNVLLWRYTGQRDVNVGTFIANRIRPELERLIGYLLNSLVLRTDLGGDPGFDELLARVKEVALGAYAHQELPFDQLIEDLQPEREMSYAPFFQVMLVFQNTPAPPLELAGLEVVRLDYEGVVVANSDWGIYLWEEGEAIGGFFEYNVDLFDAATLRRAVDQLRMLLEAAVGDPGRRISQLPVLPPAARHQLFAEWNEVPARPPEEIGFHQIFEAQAERAPEAIALVSGELELTYRELNARANRLGRHLRRLGVGPEACVGIFLEYSPEMVVAALGVMKSGGAYLPLDATHARQRVGALLEAAEAKVVLTRESLLEDLPAGLVARVVDLGAAADEIARQNGENLPNLARGSNLVYMIYTSGTTGRPKGVMIQHASLANICRGYQEPYGLDRDLVHLQMASFSFDVFPGDMTRAFGPGGKLVMCPRDVILQPHQLEALMRRHGVNAAEFVPAVVRGLMQHVDESGRDLGFMRLVVVSSDVWYVREYAELRRLAPGARVSGTYGVTELTIDSTAFQGDTTGLPLDAYVPVGRPLLGNPVYVLDRGGNPCPPGALGEMCIGGIAVARGYFKQPAATAEKFVPDAWSGVPGARLYRTGDQVRTLHDGNLEFLGRVDFQVKVRGFRIEPGEIEARLGEHPEVSQAVVVAREDVPGNRYLAAYVVSAAEPAPAASDLRGFLRARLPDYMVPTAFVPLAELPLNNNNKVDRQRLPAPEVGSEARQVTPPSTPLEVALVEIFQQLTGAARVGIEDNFFELGGHSLLATQVVARIYEAFEVEVPVRLLFEKPVLGELALAVEEELIARVETLSEQELEALL